MDGLCVVVVIIVFCIAFGWCFKDFSSHEQPLHGHLRASHIVARAALNAVIRPEESTRLHIAAEQDDVDTFSSLGVIRDLSRLRGATNSEGVTLLHRACTNNSPNVVEALCHAKADPNAYENCNWTPLMRACGIHCHSKESAKDKLRIVTALLAAGANPVQAGQMNYTPLSIVCNDGGATGRLQDWESDMMIEIVGALCAARADVNAKLDSQPSLVMAAAGRRHAALCCDLLERRADVNFVDVSAGNTDALSTAASGLYRCMTPLFVDDVMATIRVLLDAGGDPENMLSRYPNDPRLRSVVADSRESRRGVMVKSARRRVTNAPE